VLHLVPRFLGIPFPFLAKAPTVELELLPLLIAQLGLLQMAQMVIHLVLQRDFVEIVGLPLHPLLTMKILETDSSLQALLRHWNHRPITHLTQGNRSV
jgi:hypothetical protein